MNNINFIRKYLTFFQNTFILVYRLTNKFQSDLRKERKKIMNTIFNDQLFECSFLLVSILLEEYKKNIIDITDFKAHTATKISYIKDNLKFIKEIDRKIVIENLVSECIAINNS
jgi:primosomal protein N''